MVRFLTAPTVWKIRQIGLIRYEFSFPVVNQLSDEASQPLSQNPNVLPLFGARFLSFHGPAFGYAPLSLKHLPP